MLLTVKDLELEFRNTGHTVLKGLSFQIKEQEIVAFVGESGAGKSVLALSIMQLLSYPSAYYRQGSICFKDQELLGADNQVLQKIRGDRIGMIFQDPMTALNPLHPIKKQIREVLIYHKKYPGGDLGKTDRGVI